MALASARNADRKHKALVRLRQTRFFDTGWRDEGQTGRPAPVQATPPPPSWSGAWAAQRLPKPGLLQEKCLSLFVWTVFF